MTLEHLNSMPSLPSRVVLIGAGGFIGRTLTAQLSRTDTQIVPITSKDVDLSEEGSDVILGEKLAAGDSVVMLAAITPDKGRGLDAFMKNLRIAANVTKALRHVVPSHVIYFSSDAVYPFDLSPVGEASPAEPKDLYGAMHLSRELIFSGELEAPLAVLRPTLVFGAADTHNSYGPNRLRRMARDNKKITLFGGGEETRDHIFVNDVAALTIEVLKHKSQGLLNIVTGQSISYYDLAREVAAVFDDEVEVELTPRQNPITYRSFDATNLRIAFPKFDFTPLTDGVRKAHADMLAGAD